MPMTKSEKAAVEALHTKLALRWPDETRPTPLPFGFGDYDRELGTPVPGTYFVVHGAHCTRVELARVSTGYKSWRFNGKDRVERGRYFETEAEARLEMLWRACENAARELSPVWRLLEFARAAA